MGGQDNRWMPAICVVLLIVSASILLPNIVGFHNPWGGSPPTGSPKPFDYGSYCAYGAHPNDPMCQGMGRTEPSMGSVLIPD